MTKPTMRLINSTWMESTTFKLIPENKDAVFVEGIFNPTGQVLALIGKDTKDVFMTVPRLNESGDKEPVKVIRPNGKNYKEQRVTQPAYYEYYLENLEDIKAFLADHAVNYDTFDFGSFLQPPVPVPVAAAA